MRLGLVMSKLTDSGIMFCDHKVYKEAKVIFGSHKVFECDIKQKLYDGYLLKRNEKPYFYIVGKNDE